MQKKITVQNTIKVPIEKVWEYWNKPDHVVRWAFASETVRYIWYCGKRNKSDLLKN